MGACVLLFVQHCGGLKCDVLQDTLVVRGKVLYIPQYVRWYYRDFGPTLKNALYYIADVYLEGQLKVVRARTLARWTGRSEERARW